MRLPFDFYEGESELISGFNLELSSLNFIILFMIEYLDMIYFVNLSVLIFFYLKLILVFNLFFLLFLLLIRLIFIRYRFDLIIFLV